MPTPTAPAMGRGDRPPLAAFKQLQEQCDAQARLAEARRNELEACREREEALQKEVQALRTELELWLRRAEETDYRQRVLDEELVKVEAQLELIKDVLLREAPC